MDFTLYSNYSTIPETQLEIINGGSWQQAAVVFIGCLAIGLAGPAGVIAYIVYGSTLQFAVGTAVTLIGSGMIAIGSAVYHY